MPFVTHCPNQRLIIAASLLTLIAPCSNGAPKTASLSETSIEAQTKPDPQLIALEGMLSQKQKARNAGVLSTEKYQAFVVKFRGDLESLMSRIPPTPANQGLHAIILSRLSGADRQKAGSNIAQALQSNPNNPELLRARGQILYEQRDFPAAAEAARQAWEASGKKDKAAWALFKMSEGRVSGAINNPGPMTKSSPSNQPLKLDWTIPPNNDISPRAMGYIEKAMASRKKGDLSDAWVNAQAAMNADPTSVAVQKFYEAVRVERAQTQETRSLIHNAVEALDAGRGEEAVAWAQKAYERSPDENTKAILEDVRRRSAALSPLKSKKTPAQNDGLPLLPLLAAGGAGLTALGFYKVALSRGTRTSEDGIDPAPKVSTEQERRNRSSIAYVAIPAVVFGLIYGGPRAWRAAAPTAMTLIQGGQQSIQQVVTSESGAINPASVIPGFTQVETQVIQETQVIIKAPQFAQLEEAYRAGRPAIVNIGGRIIHYEPDIRGSGMTFFDEKRFYIGPDAFKSVQELHKTVLHELYRLATSQAASGVSGPLASSESDAATAFADRGIRVLKQ